MTARIPVTIFSGFLGAGKTTLISGLIRRCAGTEFAIIVNEFGTISIDGASLSQSGSKNATIHNLVGKLVGYEGDDQITPALLNLSETGACDRIVIETSGLAAPTAIMERLSASPLSEKFVLDAVITVIDTPWLLSTDVLKDAAAGPVFSNQLSAADIAVLNKMDDASHAELERAAQLVRNAAPTIRFLELAHHGQLDPELVLGVHLHEPRHKVLAHAPATEASIADGHSHSGMNAHEHGLLTHTHLHEHDPGWLSFVLHSHESQDRTRLNQAMAKLAQSQPILRAKGFVKGNKEVFAVQCVRDRIAIQKIDEHTDDHRHEHHHDHHHSHDHDHAHSNDASQLVFIGYHLDRKTIAKQLTKLTKTHWS